jgi:hypothetical protein
MVLRKYVRTGVQAELFFSRHNNYGAGYFHDSLGTTLKRYNQERYICDHNSLQELRFVFKCYGFFILADLGRDLQEPRQVLM